MWGPLSLSERGPYKVLRVMSPRVDQVLQVMSLREGRDLRKSPPPRISIGPKASAYGRVLGGGGLFWTCAIRPGLGFPSAFGVASSFLIQGLKFRDNGFPDPGFEIFLIQGLIFRDNGVGVRV